MREMMYVAHVAVGGGLVAHEHGINFSGPGKKVSPIISPSLPLCDGSIFSHFPLRRVYTHTSRSLDCEAMFGLSGNVWFLLSAALPPKDYTRERSLVRLCEVRVFCVNVCVSEIKSSREVNYASVCTQSPIYLHWPRDDDKSSCLDLRTGAYGPESGALRTEEEAAAQDIEFSKSQKLFSPSLSDVARAPRIPLLLLLHLIPPL